MKDLKAERTTRVNNIKFYLNKMKESLDYYKALDDPQWADVNILAGMEFSLKRFLNNE